MKINKFFIRFLVLLLAVQGAVAAQLLTLQSARADFSTPSVAINEVMWMGSYQGTTSHTSDEWVELRNTTANPVSIAGWQLTNVGLPVFPAGSTVPGDGYFLVSHYVPSSPSSVLNVSPDWLDSSLSISNSCSAIVLQDASLTTIDTMGCNGSDYLAGVNDATNHVRRSMERKVVVGDGSLASSWQDSHGFVNLDSSAQDHTFATPKFVNDATVPETTGALVVANNGSIFTDTATIPLTWSGFADPESNIDHYLVGVASLAGKTTGTADIQDFQSFGVPPISLTISSWPEDVNSYVLVKAVNGAGLVSDPVASLAVLYNTTAPSAVTNLTVGDLPNDHGGAVQVTWDRSASPDVIDYQMRYHKVGDLTWTVPTDLGNINQTVITGLENSPTSYEVEITAVDFTSLSSPAATATGQAIDNLAPVLDSTKVVVNQNKPGTVDTIQGLAGAVDTSSIVVKVYEGNPDLNSLLLPLGSTVSNSDGSFDPISIGDNSYATVWIQLTDNNNLLKSQPQSFANDIVGPKAPTLAKLTAKCQTDDSCRVELNWQSNDSDSVMYQVGYTTDGVEKRTLDQTGTSVLTDLTTGKTYDFAVYAFDAASNQSVASNVFEVALTKGVETDANLVDGTMVVTTAELPGSGAGVHASVSTPLSFVAPQAQAAPSSTDNTSPTTTPQTASATNQDWLRILVVAILLLVVAGGFYALSRTFKDGDGLNNVAPVEKPKLSRRTTRSGRKKPTTRKRK